GKVDRLIGLKENVIIGKLIPAYYPASEEEPELPVAEGEVELPAGEAEALTAETEAPTAEAKAPTAEEEPPASKEKKDEES
ncbi:unnamed protein product, partial [marine sediment metagenome]